MVKVLSFLYWLIHDMSHTNFTSDEWFYFFLLFLVPWHNLFQENKVCTLFTCCSAEDVTSMIALCMVSRADLHCSNSCYYIARQSWGKLDHSGPFLLGTDSAIQIVSTETSSLAAMYFWSEKPQIQNKEVWSMCI